MNSVQTVTQKQCTESKQSRVHQMHTLTQPVRTAPRPTVSRPCLRPCRSLWMAVSQARRLYRRAHSRAPERCAAHVVPCAPARCAASCHRAPACTTVHVTAISPCASGRIAVSLRFVLRDTPNWPDPLLS